MMAASEKDSLRGTISYYPVLFDLRGRLCVVVGGGTVALRKVKGLLSSGALVRVTGARIVQGLKALAHAGKIEAIEREYCQDDLAGAFLVWAATDKPEVNRQVKADGERLGIAVNVADAPDLCDFMVPSVTRRGPILITISTSGLLPVLSRKLRQELSKRLSADYVVYARKVGRFREYLKANVRDPKQRRRIMKEVAMMDITEAAQTNLQEMKRRFMASSDRLHEGTKIGRALVP